MFDDVKIHYPGIDCTWCIPDVMRYLKKTTNLTWCGYYLRVDNDWGVNTAGASVQWVGKRKIMKSMGWGLAPIYLGKQMDSPKLAEALNLKPEQKAAKLLAEGVKDGKQAAQEADKEGFLQPTVIYFDAEAKDVPQARKDNFAEYLKAWCQTVAKAGYTPGIYCLGSHALWLHSAVGGAFIWAVKYEGHGLTPNGDGGAYMAEQDKKKGKKPRPIGTKLDIHPTYPTAHPKTSGYAAATSWQMAGNQKIPVKSIDALGKEIEWPRVLVDVNTSCFADPGFPFPTVPLMPKPPKPKPIPKPAGDAPPASG